MVRMSVTPLTHGDRNGGLYCLFDRRYLRDVKSSGRLPIIIENSHKRSPLLSCYHLMWSNLRKKLNSDFSRRHVQPWITKGNLTIYRCSSIYHCMFANSAAYITRRSQTHAPNTPTPILRLSSPRNLLVRRWRIMPLAISR